MLDELFEALTLIQTGKILHLPVILVEWAYWQGLLDWLIQTVLVEGNIAWEDPLRLVVTDSIEEVSEMIQGCHHRQCWPPEARSAAAEAGLFERWER